MLHARIMIHAGIERPFDADVAGLVEEYLDDRELRLERAMLHRLSYVPLPVKAARGPSFDSARHEELKRKHHFLGKYALDVETIEAEQPLWRRDMSALLRVAEHGIERKETPCGARDAEMCKWLVKAFRLITAASYFTPERRDFIASARFK